MKYELFDKFVAKDPSLIERFLLLFVPKVVGVDICCGERTKVYIKTMFGKNYVTKISINQTKEK